MSYQHLPVMVEEVVHYLVNGETRLFMDCTLGEGGHSNEILKRFPAVNIIGLDRDKDILQIARNRLSIFQNRFQGFNLNFNEITLQNLNLNENIIDSALVDLGISVYHYKMSKKGFSFLKREKLDMRLDMNGTSVFTIINDYSEKDLADIFFKYGEERFSRIISKRIIENRAKEKIEFTDQLAEIIEKAIPRRFHPKRIHAATKCFQALRIFANNEFENIETGLPRILSLLKKGGRLGVITFHSLEDRIVKRLFAEWNKECICPPQLPVCVCGKKREVKLITKAVKPGDDEIKNNAPSRSAKFRVVEKL